MKNSLVSFIVLLISAVSLQAQKVEIITAVENIGGGYNLAYRINIPHAEAENVMKKWIRFLKDNDGKTSTSKTEAKAKDVVIKGIGRDSLQVYSSLTESDNGVMLIAAFESRDGFISPQSHPEKSRLLEQLLLDFAKKLSTEAINEKAHDAEKDLKEKKREEQKLEKNTKSLKSSNERMKKNIADNEKKIEDNERRQEELKTEIGGREEIVKNIKAKLSEL